MNELTRYDAIEWVKSLKPGDKVIHMDSIYISAKPVGILIIKKVTATGIVRTEQELSFCQNKYQDRFFVCGYGATIGKIVPYTDDLAEQARAYMQKVEKEKAEREIIENAKNICYNLAYRMRPMTLKLAKAILENVEN